jgi:hypothetical protein
MHQQPPAADSNRWVYMHLLGEKRTNQKRRGFIHQIELKLWKTNSPTLESVKEHCQCMSEDKVGEL